MTTKRWFNLIAVFFCVSVSITTTVRIFVFQEPDVLLTAGQKIDAFDPAMKRFGYSETMADMRSFEKNQTLGMWDVYEGVLVASFSSETKSVSGMSYLLEDKNDKRGKGEATAFLFDVRDFNPKTRELKIVIKEASKGD